LAVGIDNSHKKNKRAGQEYKSQSFGVGANAKSDKMINSGKGVPQIHNKSQNE